MMSFRSCKQGLPFCFSDFLFFLILLTTLLFKLSFPLLVVQSLTDDGDIEDERPA